MKSETKDATVEEQKTTKQRLGLSDEQVLSLSDKEIANYFNVRPKDGIELINERHDLQQKQGTEVQTGDDQKAGSQAGGVQAAEVQIANFFRKQKNNLDLGAVGDYLGDGAGTKNEKEYLNTQNKKVLDIFVSQIDFKEKDFVTGLREFSKKFNLPGEAQKIGRLVESFATEFCKQNPQAGYNSDDALLLAFSVMQLNSDLHNPAVKNKMTQEQYIEQLNGKKIVRGKINEEYKLRIPEVTLEKIYTEIKKDEFKFAFTKTAPGYELSSRELKNDTTFKKLDSLLKSSKPSNDELKKVFTGMGEDVECTYAPQEKSFLKRFSGHEGTITLKQGKAAVSIQVYKPNIISQYIFGKEPRTIIQPVLDAGASAKAKSSQESLNLAAKVAANFSSSYSAKATYNFEKEEMTKAYAESKTKITAMNLGDTIKASQAEKQVQGRKTSTQPVQTRPRSTGVSI